jgi:MYXO-CTERM domain-containing protein
VNVLARSSAALLFVLLAPTSVAVAGGTTSTDGESSSTGAEESTSAGDESGTTDGSCDVCPPATNTGDVEIADLDHGQPPAGERVVEVSAEPRCTCSECVCTDEDPVQIRLELDGEAVGDPCSGSQCEFVVVLTPGAHELTAIATYPSGERSTTMQLLVQDEGGSSETGAPMMDDGDDGCGCASAGGASPLSWLVLAGLARRRRRPH